MSQSHSNQPNPEDFWEHEFNQAHPPPSAEFLKKLDQKIAAHAQTLQGEQDHMSYLNSTHSPNGHYPSLNLLPAAYQNRVRRMPQLRWIAVASVLALILMGAFLTMNDGEQPIPTQSVGQLDPTSPNAQTDECVVSPETGWVVHVVATDESLADIAQHYNLSETSLREANCLGDDAAVEAATVLYLPLVSTPLAMANQTIPAGTVITTDMLSYTFWHTSTPLANTFNTPDDAVDGYALTDIEAGQVLAPSDIINNSVVFDGETYTANQDEVVFNVPNETILNENYDVWPEDYDPGTLYFNTWGNNCDNAIRFGQPPVFEGTYVGSGVQVGTCLDLTQTIDIPNSFYTGQVAAHYLYHNADNLIVSLPVDSAIQLNTFLLSDLPLQILSDRNVLQSNHVAVSVPLSQEEFVAFQSAGGWMPYDEMQLSVEIDSCDEIPADILNQMNCQDGGTRTIQARALFIAGVPYHPGDEMVGIGTFSMVPRDAAFLAWVIEAKLPIQYQD